MVDHLPMILQTGYFDIPRSSSSINQSNRSLTVICELCRQRNIECKITGYNRSVINYKRHLKLEHPEDYLKFEKASARYQLEEAKRRNHNKQDLLNNNVLNYMIEEVLPIKHLSNKNFRKIFTDISESLILLNENRFIAQTREIYNNIMDNLTNILMNVEYVALTFDALMVKDMNVFLITAHWLDNNTFERKSVILGNKIIQEDEMNLLNSNYMSCYVVKACEEFKLYQDRMISLTLNNIKKSCFLYQDFNYEFNSMSLNSIFDSQSFQVIQFDLESRSDTIMQMNCASNILLQMSTVELTKSLPEMYVQLHKTTFHKCAKLWRATHAENVDKTTSWSDYIHFLIELRDLNTDGEIFSETELLYLNEFLEISKCLLRAMESLHKDNYFHYGYFLPVLLKLKEDLSACKNNYIYFTHSIMHMMSLLNESFEQIMSFQERGSDQAIIACTLHPKIKLKWMSRIRTIENRPDNLLDMVTEKCIRAVQEVSQSLEAYSVLSEVSQEIFIDDDEPRKTAYESKIEDEVKSFLLDRHRSYDVLQKYPNVKKAFLKYNTPICSSKPITNLLISSKLLKAFSADYDKELFEMIPIINCFNASSVL